MPDRMGKKKNRYLQVQQETPKVSFITFFSFSNQSFNISVCISFSGTKVVILFSIGLCFLLLMCCFSFLSFFSFLITMNFIKRAKKSKKIPRERIHNKKIKQKLHQEILKEKAYF